MQGHTPGPWTAQRVSNATPTYVLDADGHRNVFLVSTQKLELPEIEANARLIAASPDLYEACKAFAAVGWPPMYGHTSSAFRDASKLLIAAINKAEGRG